MRKRVCDMKTWYCPNCGEITDTRIDEREETFFVKGKPITRTAQVRICSHCDEEIVDEDLDEATLRLFYDAYRESERLLTSEDIRNIRKKYKLSQSSFSKLLGFGEKTITRYENGAIQDECHDNLIRLMQNIDAFEDIWRVRKNILSESENKKITQIIGTYRIYPKTIYSSKIKYVTQESFCVYRNKGDERNVG